MVLAETAENVAHGLSQAMQKRSLPRAAMSDNGAAMTATEITEGNLVDLVNQLEQEKAAGVPAASPRNCYAMISSPSMNWATCLSAGQAASCCIKPLLSPPIWRLPIGRRYSATLG